MNPDRLLRAYQDFLSVIEYLKDDLIDSSVLCKDTRRLENNSCRTLGELAIETICLWCRRAPYDLRMPPISAYDDLFSDHQVINQQSIGASESVAIKSCNALNSILIINPAVRSELLLSSGAVPSLIHATTSSCCLLQASSCCCLQNLSASNERARHLIANEGGISLLIDLARDASYTLASAAACGTLQNLALAAEYESSIVQGGGIKVLLKRCKDRWAAPDRPADPYLIESAAMALKNLSAGSEATRKELGRQHGVPILADLLEMLKIHNPNNGITELRIPSPLIVAAAASALQALSMEADLQAELGTSSFLPHLAALLDRLLRDAALAPLAARAARSGPAGELGDGLASAAGAVRNLGLQDCSGKARAAMHRLQLAAIFTRVCLYLLGQTRAPPPATTSPAQTGAADEVDEGRTSTMVAGVRQLGGAGLRLLRQTLAALRNMLAGHTGLQAQEQAGAAGCVELLCSLISLSASADHPTLVLVPPTAHRGVDGAVDAAEVGQDAGLREEVGLEALQALANLTQICETNRHRALATGCLRNIMTMAAGSCNGKCRPTVAGAACLVLQSLSQHGPARARIAERDGIRLLARIIMNGQACEEELAGAAGCLGNLCRTSQQLMALATTGITKVLARLCQDCQQDIVLFEIASLLSTIAEVESLRGEMMDSGALRSLLRLLDPARRRPDVQLPGGVGRPSSVTSRGVAGRGSEAGDGVHKPDANGGPAQLILEVAATVIAFCAQDTLVKPYLIKIGAAEVLAARSASIRGDTEKLRRSTRMALNRLTAT